MSSFKVGDEVSVRVLADIPNSTKKDDEFLKQHIGVVMEVTSVMKYAEFPIRTNVGGFMEHELELAKPIVDLRSIYEV